MTFVNTTAIAYYKNHEALADFYSYVIAVVFTNVMRLRVSHIIAQSLELVQWTDSSYPAARSPSKNWSQKMAMVMTPPGSTRIGL